MALNTHIKISHVASAGFFSCCTKILYTVINSINNNIIPTIIDATNIFHLYKKSGQTNILGNFFNTKYLSDTADIIDNTPIVLSSTTNEHQFSNYQLINFASINPIIGRYFLPSPLIGHIIDTLLTKYSIDYTNTCVIRYRGTDKKVETSVPNYSEFIEKALKIKSNNPDIRFLVLTDETEFLNECIKAIPDIIYIKEMATISSAVGRGIHNSTIDVSRDIYFFLASIYIASKCKYIITTSGNCDIWIILFRGHCRGVLQYLEHKQYIYGVKNSEYSGRPIWYDSIDL